MDAFPATGNIDIKMYETRETAITTAGKFPKSGVFKIQLTCTTDLEGQELSTQRTKSASWWVKTTKQYKQTTLRGVITLKHELLQQFQLISNVQLMTKNWDLSFTRDVVVYLGHLRVEK